MKVLLAAGAVDVNARDKKQWTALHHAAGSNRAEVAKLLLSIDDVDVNARDLGGSTAFDVAKEHDASACVALLRDWKGDHAHFAT